VIRPPPCSTLFPYTTLFRSVVVDDFHFVRIIVLPSEANPPLIVDADRMLSLAFALQRFQSVAGRQAQIVEPFGVVQQTEPSQRRSEEHTSELQSLAYLVCRL